MANADSGIKSASRFFSFRWAYIALAGMLWFLLISLLFFANNGTYDSLMQSTNLLVYAATGNEDLSQMRLHGVFGMLLEDNSWEDSFLKRVFSPSNIASSITVLLLIGLIAAYVIPEAGKTKNLPATRGIHMRARITSSLIFGLGLTALMAGLLDIFKIQEDLTEFFMNRGWLSMGQYGGFYNIHGYGYYWPNYGLATTVSWCSTLAGVAFYGLGTWVFMTFVPLGRDRYWQAERWTLVFTLFGMVLTMVGIYGMIDDYRWHSSYDQLDIFLGGFYTSWVVGLIILTWAWSSRTCLFVMSRRYEKAFTESDEPVCFACGYDLRMLSSDKCPECGTVVHSKVLIKLREASANQAESRSTTR